MGVGQPRETVTVDRIETATRIGLAAMKDVPEITITEIGSAAASIFGAVIDIVVEQSLPQNLTHNKMALRAVLMELESHIDPPVDMN